MKHYLSYEGSSLSLFRLETMQNLSERRVPCYFPKQSIAQRIQY